MLVPVQQLVWTILKLRQERMGIELAIGLAMGT